MIPGGVDPARLYSALLNTGLQTKDNALYQVIYQLINQMVKLTAISAGGSSGSGGNIVNNYTQIIQQLGLDDGSSGNGEGEMGPPGVRGIDGINGMIPYYISPSEVFNIPEYKQALFSMNIDNEGILEVDGFLIEVD